MGSFILFLKTRVSDTLSVYSFDISNTISAVLLKVCLFEPTYINLFIKFKNNYLQQHCLSYPRDVYATIVLLYNICNGNALSPPELVAATAFVHYH